MTGLTLTGQAAQASSSLDSTRVGTCKQISSLLKDIRDTGSLARVYLGFYYDFDAAGDDWDENAQKSLDKVDRYLKEVTKLVKTGSSMARNSQMKREFKRWYNISIRDLDNGESLERKSVKKIESLLIDGKC